VSVPAWTAADAAELDAVAWQLVHSYADHLDRCPACACADRSCRALQHALDAITDWLTARRLLSQAEYLRRLEGGRL
jgi:DNA-binding helix-hairpin-helix protein with protein kinase domain